MRQAASEVTGNLDWDGLHRPKIYYAVITTFCGLFLSVLDGTICNVALPTIALRLDISPSDSIWIVNAFQLVIMMFLLPFASLGELFGYKKVYLYGVVVFTLGSLFCALSHTFHVLVASRVIQGAGAAMIMSVNTSLIKIIYPKRHLGKGVGLNATVVAIASVTGPSLAAAILSVATWEWLFAINIPIGIVTWFMGRKFLPDNPTRVVGRHFNVADTVLNAATFGLMIGCIEAYSHGLDWHKILIAVAVFFLVGFIYVRTQLRKEYPMLPHGDGYDAVGTGLIMTASPLAIMFVAPAAGWMIGKIHPGILGGAGIFLMSVSCCLLAFMPQDVSHFGFVWRIMLFGAGFGLFQSPNNHILLSSAPAHRSGSAGGMLASARLIGQTTGAALVAMMFNFFDSSAPHKALLLGAVLALCGSLLSSMRLKVKRIN